MESIRVHMEIGKGRKRTIRYGTMVDTIINSHGKPCLVVVDDDGKFHMVSMRICTRVEGPDIQK